MGINSNSLLLTKQDNNLFPMLLNNMFWNRYFWISFFWFMRICIHENYGYFFCTLNLRSINVIETVIFINIILTVDNMKLKHG